MKVNRKVVRTLESIFPDPRGRRAADAAIDALPIAATLRDAMHAWERAYFEATGTSPFRSIGGWG